MPGHPCQCRLCKGLGWETHALLSELARLDGVPRVDVVVGLIRRAAYGAHILDGTYDDARLTQAREGPPSRRRRQRARPDISPPRMPVQAEPAVNEPPAWTKRHYYSPNRTKAARVGDLDPLDLYLKEGPRDAQVHAVSIRRFDGFMRVRYDGKRVIAEADRKDVRAFVREVARGESDAGALRVSFALRSFFAFTFYERLTETDPAVWPLSSVTAPLGQKPLTWGPNAYILGSHRANVP